MENGYEHFGPHLEPGAKMSVAVRGNNSWMVDGLDQIIRQRAAPIGATHQADARPARPYKVVFSLIL